MLGIYGTNESTFIGASTVDRMVITSSRHQRRTGSFITKDRTVAVERNSPAACGQERKGMEDFIAWKYFEEGHFDSGLGLSNPTIAF